MIYQNIYLLSKGLFNYGATEIAQQILWVEIESQEF